MLLCLLNCPCCGNDCIGSSEDVSEKLNIVQAGARSLREQEILAFVGICVAVVVALMRGSTAPSIRASSCLFASHIGCSVRPRTNTLLTEYFAL